MWAVKEQARNSGANTFVWDIKIDSFSFVIDSAIKALEQEPILDKIRAEIEMEKLEDSPNFCIKAHNNAVERALQIIDKYKVERKESNENISSM